MILTQRHRVVDARHVGAEDLPEGNVMTAVARLEQTRTPGDLADNQMSREREKAMVRKPKNSSGRSAPKPIDDPFKPRLRCDEEMEQPAVMARIALDAQARSPAIPPLPPGGSE